MALLHVDFYSDALGRSTHMDAILPEKSSSHHWKTLYLLHGMTDDHSTWQRRTSVERYAEERELAVILPDGDLKWYADTPWGESYFDFVSRELVQITRRMFPRLSRDRADTFVAGNERGLRLDRPVAVGGVEVGVADARGDELDEGLVVSGSGQVDVLDDDRGAELLDDSSGERIGHGADPSGWGKGVTGTLTRPSL